MALDSLLTVTSLAAGATYTVAHGLELTPNCVVPDRATPIYVQSVDATNVTFYNAGASSETANFLARVEHSIQTAIRPTRLWQGVRPATDIVLATPQWDDVRVPITATQAFGLNAPSFGLFMNNGSVGTGYALSFNGSTSRGIADEDFGDFAATYSICFWMQSSYTGVTPQYIIDKANSFSVQFTNRRVRMAIQGFANVDSAQLSVNARTFVCIVVTEAAGGASTQVDIYLDNVLSTTTTIASGLPGDTVNAVNIGQRSTNTARYSGTLDELRFYQAALTTTDINDLWDSGTGTTNEPTSTPTLIAGYHFDEGSGSKADNYEGTAGYDITIVTTSWVTGLTDSAASGGVHTYLFDPTIEQSLSFTAQLPHGYVLGSEIYSHFHWAPMTADAGNVVWGIEYTIQDINGTFANTTVLTATGAASGAKKHSLTAISTAIPGQSSLSSMMIGRLFRQAGSASDTYAFDAALLEWDMHIQMDQLGSHSEYVK